MISKIRPVKVKRIYRWDEWRPHFAWRPIDITFSVPGAPHDINGHPERVRCWAWLSWIETKSRDHDDRWPWVYRLRLPE